MPQGQAEWKERFQADWKWKLEPRYSGLIRLIDEAMCGILVEDEEGRIEYANQRLLEWGGYDEKDLEGQPAEITVPEELRENIAVERDAVHAGDFRTRLSVFLRKDGRTFPVAVVPQRMDTDQVDTVVVSLLIDLAEVHTARPVGAREGSMAADLSAIANKLQSMSFTAAVSDGTVMPADHPVLAEVSAREREILELLVGGSRVPAIAKQLFISPNTVRNHLKAIFRKVGVSSQSELIERVRSLTAG